MEKMCVTHIFDRELIFKICEEVIQLKSKSNLILKWSDDINKPFFFFQNRHYQWPTGTSKEAQHQ